MSFIDAILSNPRDAAKVDEWVRKTITGPVIEELFKPENLNRLAFAIATEINRGAGK